MAPPLTLVTARSMPISSMKSRQTEENASLISQRSISEVCMPAFASALRDAGAGPVSMMHGSLPTVADRTIRARGRRPKSLPGFLAAEQNRRGAVDDTGRVAGVMDVVDLLDLGMLLNRDGVEPEVAAHHLEARFELREVFEAWCRAACAHHDRAS